MKTEIDNTPQINKFYVTGDKHGKINDMLFKLLDISDEAIGVIILGDCGINFFLNYSERFNKIKMQNSGHIFYLLQGNHEERPELLPNISKVFDYNVKNEIYFEKEFYNIRYLINGNVYQFGNYSAFVAGGAYSVDKYFRLENNWKWFPNEQLSEDERKNILSLFELKKDNYYDFVFTHTLPKKFTPIDLFLSYIDQEKVDKTMEDFLDQIEEKTNYTVWCGGHYHVDREQAPHVEILFNNIIDLDDLYNKWTEIK